MLVNIDISSSYKVTFGRAEKVNQLGLYLLPFMSILMCVMMIMDRRKTKPLSKLLCMHPLIPLEYGIARLIASKLQHDIEEVCVLQTCKRRHGNMQVQSEHALHIYVRQTPVVYTFHTTKC